MGILSLEGCWAPSADNRERLSCSAQTSDLSSRLKIKEGSNTLCRVPWVILYKSFRLCVVHFPQLKKRQNVWQTLPMLGLKGLFNESFVMTVIAAGFDGLFF